MCGYISRPAIAGQPLSLMSNGKVVIQRCPDMNTLFLLLLFIFGGVALIALLTEKFASPMEPEKMRKLSRWFISLVALSIIIRLIQYWLE